MPASPSCSSRRKRSSCAPRVVLLDDGVADVRPVEAGDEERASSQLQPLDDVGARVVVGGGGQRQPRHAGEALVQHAQAQVLLAEVVAPLADAMRLVDGEQAEQPALVQRIQHRQEARRQDALGRRVQQHQPARAAARARWPSASVACRACCSGRLACTPSSSSAPTWSCISAISGRHHHRHAAPGAVAHDGRHLVAQALAAAGGHQHQRVAAADHVVDDRAPASPRKAG